jgi:hypothetical protein
MLAVRCGTAQEANYNGAPRLRSSGITEIRQPLLFTHSGTRVQGDHELGRDLSLARRRRRLSQASLAERMSVSLMDEQLPQRVHARKSSGAMCSSSE